MIGDDNLALSEFAWQNRANCRDNAVDEFYPEGFGRAPRVKYAKRVCSACDVRAECLAWALDNDERHGIWGGLTERERMRLAKGLEPKRFERFKIQPEIVERMTELYEDGLSLIEVAEKVGCSPDAVRVHLKRIGVKLRPRGGRRSNSKGEAA